MNITLQDSMEESDMMILMINGTSDSDVMPIQSTICARRMLFEGCTLEEQDQIAFDVVLKPKICYLDEQQAANSKTQESAITCALSDYIKCRSNQISNCKFIDCFNTQNQDDGSIIQDYLFSTCIPQNFEDSQIKHICQAVASGNDYKDYYVDEDNGSTFKKWRIGNMKVFTVVIFAVAIIMTMVCCCSCYYNYKQYKTGMQPFEVPICCPTCLFPRDDELEILRKMQTINQMNDSVDDRGLTNGGYTAPTTKGYIELKTKKELSIHLEDED